MQAAEGAACLCGSVSVAYLGDDRALRADVVVAADAEGNIAAISRAINTVFVGKKAIVVDGVTIEAGSSVRRRARFPAGSWTRAASGT